jgi:hypothetical protein
MTSKFFLVFLLLPGISWGQNSDGEQEPVKTNLEVFEDIISAQLEKFLYYPGLDRELAFIFSVNHTAGGESSKNDNEERFITNVVKKTAQNNKLKFSLISGTGELKADSNSNLVRLQVYNLETKYTGFRKNNFLGEKTLERNVKIKIAIDINSSSGKFELKNFISSDYKDEVSYDSYKKLESSKYAFTRGKAPEVGFIERIIVPAALVTVSAAVIVMFFVLRTK